MAQAKIGLIGLAVMGQNLVLNFANKGIPIAVFNRTTSKMEKFVADNEGKPIFGEKTMEDFVRQVERPRKIILLVQAGAAVDAMINNVASHLDEGDIIIDGGNSFFQDTIRREQELKNRGIRFSGMGVSGGEKGALEGPSLMPGGDRDVYDELSSYLLKVAAQDPAPCVDFMGRGGAGHFVKMVHNGIEYADMQLIAEIYDIAKNGFNFNSEDMCELFEHFKTTDLNSYLIDITHKILTVKDELTGALLVDKIVDEAKGKGTGMWTVQEGARLGTPVPAISAALDSRYISSSNELREIFKRLFTNTKTEASPPSKEEAFSLLQNTLLAGKILAYAQGFYMLRVSDAEYGFGLNYSSIAKIWRNGCIIRSTMLDEMARAFENKNLISLLEDDFFLSRVKASTASLRKVLCLCIEHKLPATAFATSLSYLDGLSSPQLPTNLIQAQRDFFGAHTYRRVDKAGDFHTDWETQ